MTRPRQPANIPDAAAKARRTNVLLEELLGEFKTFGEGLTAVRKRADQLEPKVNQLVSEFETFKVALGEVAKDVKALKKDVTEIKERLQAAEAKLAP